MNCAGWYLGRVSSRGVNSGTLVKSSDGMEVGPMCAGMCELGMVDSDPSRDSYMGFCSGAFCEYTGTVVEFGVGRVPLGQ